MHPVHAQPELRSAIMLTRLGTNFILEQNHTHTNIHTNTRTNSQVARRTTTSIYTIDR